MHTGSRLTENSMTLDDLERQNSGFYEFFGYFGLRDTFQERYGPKSIEIDMEKLWMKFSALNADLDGPVSIFTRDSRMLRASYHGLGVCPSVTPWHCVTKSSLWAAALGPVGRSPPEAEALGFWTFSGSRKVAHFSKV